MKRRKAIPPIRAMRVASRGRSAPRRHTTFSFLCTSTGTAGTRPGIRLGFGRTVDHIGLGFIPKASPRKGPIALASVRYCLMNVGQGNAFSARANITTIARSTTIDSLHRVLGTSGSCAFATCLLPRAVKTRKLRVRTTVAATSNHHVCCFLRVPMDS